MIDRKEIRNKQAKLSRDALSDSYLLGLMQKGTSLKTCFAGANGKCRLGSLYYC